MRKAEKYEEIRRSFAEILKEPMPFESALVSLLALMKSNFETISWIGLYRASNHELWVGPYQGPLACIHIPFGKGVCGKSAEEGKTIIVPNVHEFEGHIACDSKSLSEIVVPVFRKGELVGVLDIDSHQEAAFDKEDEKGISSLLLMLDEHLLDGMI